ncbi:MAG: DUF4178 domain-containing protein [Pseudomonadota bacterium]
MATDPPVQRTYRAACPQCGAPVDFQSAASAFAVCSFCRSTLAREGEALRRIGQSAELFDDHSPLQLGVRGRWQKEPFTLIGRLQYRYRDGTWSEWHALFDSGRSGWLSEDNGRYVLVFPVAVGPLPPAASVPMESRVLLDGQGWMVAAVQRVSLIAAQGELPQAPVAEGVDFMVAELRSDAGEVLSLDYSEPAEPQATRGRNVRLAELDLSGLVAAAGGAEGGAAEKTLSAQGLSCPSCGAGLAVQLSTTRSIVCGQCQAVVDVSSRLGGELPHYRQEPGESPRIPLGAVGVLTLDGEMRPWQVVGYAERCELEGDGDDDEAQSFWREYLLYHRTEGFTFLVDAEEGWSWATPLTGAPSGRGRQFHWQGVDYQHRYDYRAHVTFVLGEFYWQLQRGAISQHSDYAGTGAHRERRLNRERTGDGEASEVVWSAGATLDPQVVATAFKLPVNALQNPGGSLTGGHEGDGSLMGTFVKVLVWIFIILVVLSWLVDCSDGSGSGYRGSSGYGGYSSGGSHK